MGVTAPGMETPLGTGPPTGVPPEAKTMVAPPTVTVVVTVGTCMTIVVVELMKVSEVAPEEGAGLGSFKSSDAVSLYWIAYSNKCS